MVSIQKISCATRPKLGNLPKSDRQKDV